MQKQYSPTLFVILSLIPIANFYPLRILGEIKRMVFIDAVIVGVAYLSSFMMLESHFTLRTGALIPIALIIPLFMVVQGILVYGWTKEYNAKHQLIS